MNENVLDLEQIKETLSGIGDRLDNAPFDDDLRLLCLIVMLLAQRVRGLEEAAHTHATEQVSGAQTY